MKKTIFILFILFLNSVFGQNEPEIKIFHRLVLINAENKIMVVKVENANVWVTQGFYQTQDETIQNGLNNLAKSYGIEIEEPKLRGVFLLKREINNEYSTSLRNVYVAKIESLMLKKPTGIDEIKWVSVDEATELITFPHISLMIKGVIDTPNRILGGTLRQFKENDIWKTEIIEEFYSL
ncbi:hypothetical protein DZC72_07970 [Maribacter algicola]|uniref:NUDIX hydrolase n=1 Tax=Maribacter algicola TaxID=2498892 RepID=A0A3R8Q1Q0_9FLAO|nr:hypothetical protein [Maribacter algicola]RRQ50472.1 hypothetical protein DZC72_07970 [Maribacter algicola]